MGIVGRVLSFFRVTRGSAFLSEVKSALSGSNHNRTVAHFSAPNEDSAPLPGDFELVIKQRGTGRYAVVGYADTVNAKKSEGGEKRLFSRNAGGTEVAELWLKNDGSIRLSNAFGYFELKPDGSVESNGAKITLIGDFITASGVSLMLHTHAVTTAPGTTGPAIPTP
jgi:hypothetical protein